MTAQEIQEVRSQVQTYLLAYWLWVETELGTWLEAQTPVGFKETEEAVSSLGRDLSDRVTGAILHGILGSDTFRSLVIAALQTDPDTNLRSGGKREVEVTLLGGGTVRVETDYFKPNRRGPRRGRRRGTGRRGKGGSGVYPLLAALGVRDRLSPATASEISLLVVGSDSVRAGRQALERRGLDLGHKETLRVVNSVGERLVEHRNAWLARIAGAAPPVHSVLRGKRVVVATDGGRIRIRTPHKGRKRKNGHHGFDADWKEPKLLVIYVVDNKGKVLDTFRPVIDGTMGDADAVYEMIASYLKVLGVHEAEHLTVLGDGAVWIWNRVEKLIKATGIDTEKVTAIIDLYHAIEVLGKIAGIPKLSKKWTSENKKTWLKRAKKLLRAGRIEELLLHIQTLAVGRRSKKVKSHMDYFGENKERMRYKAFRARGLTIGSGAIESAVRRVVNLRLKSNAKYWRSENAEHMLLSRSYLKAGRFDDLFAWSLAESTRWWVGREISPTPLGIPLELQPAPESLCEAAE